MRPRFRGADGRCRAIHRLRVGAIRGRRECDRGAMEIDDARNSLLSREDLERRGTTAQMLRASLARGDLHRVDHGRYVEMTVWRSRYVEGRHLLRVVAAAERQRGTSLVFSHASAAVMHGLPLFRMEPARVHLSGSAANGQVLACKPTVARHEVPVPDEDIVEIGGIRCTSLPRAVAEVVRSAPRETGIAVLDAALRKGAWCDRSRTYDVDRAETLRAQIGRHLPKGGRGVRRGREILMLGDGRIESPGESVSHLYLRDIGFPPPLLQAQVPGPGGTTYYVDFELDGAFGEFDGMGKYIDPVLRGGRGIEEVVVAEKRREDWIRGMTGKRVVRWGTADIADAATFEQRLARFGLTPRGRAA